MLCIVVVAVCVVRGGGTHLFIWYLILTKKSYIDRQSDFQTAIVPTNLRTSFTPMMALTVTAILCVRVLSVCVFVVCMSVVSVERREEKVLHIGGKYHLKKKKYPHFLSHPHLSLCPTHFSSPYLLTR